VEAGGQKRDPEQGGEGAAEFHGPNLSLLLAAKLMGEAVRLRGCSVKMMRLA
jgi:hypothetical protein